MRMPLLAILFFFCFLTIKAQPNDFGKITVEELRTTYYSPDSSAAALILFDKGESSLNDRLEVTLKRHTRIKFFSKEAIDDWANHTIILEHGEDDISRLKAITYNLEEGKIVESEMEGASIFKTRINRYTDQIKFTLPNVKEGSVVEYSYTLRTTASSLPSWKFQQSIPVKWSEYHTYIPRSFNFRKDVQGFLSFSEYTSSKDGDFERWVIKDVPAFKEEPFITTPEDYVSEINFYLSSVFIPGRPIINLNRSASSIVWELTNDQDFGIQIKMSGFLKKIVAETTTGIIEDEKKMRAVFDYVRANVSWNSHIDKIPDHSFKKVLEEKKGSSSEINLLLVSMLQKAGLRSFPVLLSTRKHGLIRPFAPLFSQFNDVICLVKIGGKNILLDGTNKYLPMDALPERCLNGKGLVVSVEDMEWVALVSSRSRMAINVNFKVDETGALSGNMTISRDGIDGAAARKSFEEAGQEKYVKAFLIGKTWELSGNRFENMDNPNQSAKEVYDVIVQDHTQVAGALIYLNPYLFGRLEENKLQLEKRLYPVDFATPFDKIYQAKIQIPDAYRIEELPKAKVILLPLNGGKFVYSATLIENAISFTSQFIINKSVFGVEEYPALREFYNLVVSKQSELIVLKKIE